MDPSAAPRRIPALLALAAAPHGWLRVDPAAAALKPLCNRCVTAACVTAAASAASKVAEEASTQLAASAASLKAAEAKVTAATREAAAEREAVEGAKQDATEEHAHLMERAWAQRDSNVTQPSDLE